ncbi:esterase E4 [Amyelois transitella]|uniref:esterase E4 n=1 Tax=Amyelois transitella TaxID=680683 RepID=UPI00298FFF94|nr:esterase E4 [Amyelois transitella]
MTGYLIILGCIVVIVNGDIIVETESGKIAGVEVKSIINNEKYYSFMGIPYAEPPVGKLRFMPPKPHPGWSDILKAKKEKKPCAQQNLSIRSREKYGFCGTEDCLYLSIHTPRLPNDQPLDLPVIVFLYNENFKMSHNSSKEFGPDFFMNEDVIIVTIQHRVGVLGFLSFEDELLPGNNGIRDVILAVNWIKQNIKYFGGNSDKITLMGSDGGGVIVDILLHSPKAKGLFSGAIIQGTTSWGSSFFNGDGKKRAMALAEKLERPAKTSTSLLKVFDDFSSEILTENEDYAVHADEPRAKQIGVISFGPIIEHDHPDAIITKLPDESEINIDIPIMIGRNSREGIELCERYYKRPQFLTFADRDLLLVFPIRVNYHFEVTHNKYFEVIKELKDYFFEEGYVRVGGMSEYVTYLTDMLGMYPLDYTVKQYVNASKAPVYYYTFDYSGEFNYRKQLALKDAATIDGTWGATISDDLCYLFVCKPIKKAYVQALKEEDSDDMKVLRHMVKMWTNFAKTRDPNPSGGDFKWTPATKENRDTLLINEDPEMKKKINDEIVTFWDNFIEKYRNLAVDGVIKDDDTEKDEL